MIRAAIAPLLLLATLGIGAPPAAGAADYYVRQTVGDDGHDGRAPATAWRSLARLSHLMQAGDTVYVGPGLYREQITVLHDGTPDRRLSFVADPSGRYTGDPPGAVMITGADPVDKHTFQATDDPGVYRADVTVPVLGVVEMDGPQRRYLRTRDATEVITDGVSERDAVTHHPASHSYDAAAHVLFVHTSDGKPPATHEIELIHRGNGFAMTDRHFVTIRGFALRHFGDAAISFFTGSSDGIADGNIAYGGRQGIRVYGAQRIRVSGNTLFRNDNSGVYFALASSAGHATANVAYENVKGLRWSSGSGAAIATDNVLFENREAGIAIEDVDEILLRRNLMARNAQAQLMVLRSVYHATDNCFVIDDATTLVADFVFGERYPTLAAYQQGRGQDLDSRTGGCAALPPKLDVGKLHRETTTYAARARVLLLEGAPASPTPSPRAAP